MSSYFVSVGQGSGRKSEKRDAAIWAEAWIDENRDQEGPNSLVEVLDNDAGRKITFDELRARADKERATAFAVMSLKETLMSREKRASAVFLPDQ